MWYAVKYPAMYCTAIVAGICFALWAVYFVIDSFYICDAPKIWEVCAGALCGALVFGCRPPIGIMEIVMIPFIICSVKRQLSAGNNLKKVIGQAVAFVVPYIIIAVLLMLYNYVRFDNPFEFGQRYQLSILDFTALLDGAKENLSIIDWANGVGNYLFGFEDLQKTFPWITEKLGLLVMFPILFIAFQSWHTEDKCLGWFRILLLVSAGIIIEGQVLGAWVLVTRYRSDFTFILCLAVLFKVIYEYDAERKEKNIMHKYSLFINYISLYVMAIAFLEFFTAGDAALLTENPELINKLSNFFALHSIM